MGKPWTLKEIEICKKFAESKTCKQIAEILGRTTAGVVSMFYKQQIKKVVYKIWDDEKVEILLKYYKTGNSKMLAKKLPDFDLSQISNKAYALGLRKKKKNG